MEMSEMTRIFCPAFLSLTTLSNTRSIIFCFDFQCLGLFMLMFLVDPIVHARIYFVFYLSILTVPTAYVVIFGTKNWLRIGFITQLIRMVLIGLHNVFYPLFVTAHAAIEYEGTHPGASYEEIMYHSILYGAMIFLWSLFASIWEPAKLYQIYRLLHMIDRVPIVSMAELLDDHEVDDDANSISDAESINLSDSGYFAIMTTV